MAKGFQSDDVTLTVFADASFCTSTRAAGWGAWAKRTGWATGVVFGGELKTKPVNSTHAELMGIANALHHLKGQGSLEGLTVIYVQCDSVQALEAVGYAVLNHTIIKPKDNGVLPVVRKNLPGHLAPAAAMVKELVGTTEVRLRHVRGHKEGITTRSWVNEQCDTMAKHHMRAARFKDTRWAKKHAS